MKKVFTLLCCCVVLSGIISCEQYVEYQESIASPHLLSSSAKVKNLVQQARLGRVEAYDSLAICYSKGDGVKQSSFNMLAMYMLSCERSGKKIEDVINSLDANNPLRLFFDIADHHLKDDFYHNKIADLRAISPADALVCDAMRAIDCEEDTLKAKRLLLDAEEEGSDWACVLQIVYCWNEGDQHAYKQALHKLVGKFPIFYVKLGDWELQNKECGYLERAVDYYREADEHGMLTMRAARRLSSVYRELEASGKKMCDEQEMKRLETFSCKNK